MPAGQIERRTLQVDASRLKAEDRTVPASLSSELPVERFWGIEVLDHTPGSVNLSRAVSGAFPLLASHDASELPRPGNLEQVRLEGRKLRGVLRFAKTKRGDELLDAVREGTLREVSIGYQIDEVREEKDSNGQKVFRVTRWTLLEASVVNLAADPTVGILRQLPRQKESEVMPPEIEVTSEDRAVLRERQRIESIRAIGLKNDMRELAEKAITEGTTLEDFRKRFIEELGKRQPPHNPDAPRSREYGFERELGAYSLRKAILAAATSDWRDAGREREISETMGRSLGRESEGLLVPLGILAQRDVTKAGTGQYVIATDLLADQFIDVLRPASVVMSLGATMLPGLVGNCAIPRKSSGSVAYWVTEGNPVTESTPVFDQVTLTPKTCGGLVETTRKMLLQSTPAIEQLLRNDLLGMIGTEIDRVAINGKSASNEPVGILNTAGIGSVSQGNTAVDWTTIVNLEREVDIDNALTGRLAYLTNPRVKAQAKVEEIASPTAQMLWSRDNTERPLNGYPCGVTSNVPSNLGGGTNRSALIFGDFASLLIGTWGVIEILVNPYSETQFPKGNILVRGMVDVDVALRHVESFAACIDIDHAAV